MPLNNENNNECCKCTTPEIHIELNKQGPQGRQGNPGLDGFSPDISIAENTENSFKLRIEDKDGVITTPNLKATLPVGGQEGTVLTKNSSTDGDVSWQMLPNASPENPGMVELATTEDMTPDESGEINDLKAVTPALFNNELTKQVQNFIVAGDNITTSVDDEGKVTINAEAEPYTLPQANATALGGVKANPKTDEDTQPVNIDAATGLLYTKAGGGTELVPATDTTLGGVIIGDGLSVDTEGVTSLDLDVEEPLQIVESIPSNPHIESGADGKGVYGLDVIAFTPKNGHSVTEDVNQLNTSLMNVGDTVTLSIKNRTNNIIDWENNILEAPLYIQDNAMIFAIGFNWELMNISNINSMGEIGTIYANRDLEGNITPLLYITTEIPFAEGNQYNKSCGYKFLDNGTAQDNSTTNYQLECIYSYRSAWQAANGPELMYIVKFIRKDSGLYEFDICGNQPIFDSNRLNWNNWLFYDKQSSTNWHGIAQNIDTSNIEINCVFYVLTPKNNDHLYNKNYPFLAKYTGNINAFGAKDHGFPAVVDAMTQHYVEASPASGTPKLSLNYDNSTIKVNENNQLYADVAIPDNITTQGNTFNGANQLVQLDASGKLPAIDGSQLTNLPGGSAPTNMVTTDTEQTITGDKVFTGTLTLGNNSSTYVYTNGTGNINTANLYTDSLTIGGHYKNSTQATTKASSSISFTNINHSIQNPIDLLYFNSQDKFSVGNTDCPLILEGSTITANGNNIVTTNDTTPLVIWRGTQLEYDGITSKDANTLYIITG